MESLEFSNKQEWLKLRTQDITSTEISALFNSSPYLTHFELWHSKKSEQVTELEMNERMKWGVRLEPIIAEAVALDNNWEIKPLNEYMRDPEHRLGASFDYEIPDQNAILEIKNVDSLVFKNDWVVDANGNIEAPAHIEFQIQLQLYVSGRELTQLAVLVGGNQIRTLRRVPNGKVIDAIKKAADAFWQSIRENNPPQPNFEADAAFISKLYKYAHPGEIISGDYDIGTLATEYRNASEAIKHNEKLKKAAKAEILTLIGSSEKVIGEQYTISAKTTQATWVEGFEKKTFRNFRVNWRKQK